MNNQTIIARLEDIVFENPGNAYVVGVFTSIENGNVFTGAGRIENPLEDQVYTLTGKETYHKKYGKQFQIISALKKLPVKKDVVIRLLSGPDFPGIGAKTAQDIVDVLGEECLEMIFENPEVLKEVPKLNDAKRKSIVDGVCKHAGFNEGFVKLSQYGLSERQINSLNATYADALKVVEEDCFAPYYDIPGFGYKTALKLADATNVPFNDPKRLEAMIFEEIRQLSFHNGDTFLTFAQLYERVKPMPTDFFEISLASLQHKRKIVIEQQMVYPYPLYFDEIDIAKLMAEHLFKVDAIDEERIEKEISVVEFANNIEYDEVQKEGIRAFFSNSLTILNGGPGTGKSTTVKGILSLIHKFYPEAKVHLCAPTGRASKRLSQLAEQDARTIHSLFKWDKENNTFGINEHEPLSCDFLIIDEFSMVDTHLFASVLRGLEKYTRILLIGDEDQLESVSPGKVFNDIINARICPIVRLEKVFRQSAGSGIAQLAKDIRLENKLAYQDGVIFENKPTSSLTNYLLSQIEKMDADDYDSFQILAPKYKGAVGIDYINEQVQQLLNPYDSSKKQMKVGPVIFRENDKVMLLKNMPEENVYNGDIGRIIRIDPKTKIITVDFDVQVVEFSEDILAYLSLAYCISVHKSQGSEYPYVFVIADPTAAFMLNKRLLYTAVSRAKKQLYIIGDQVLFENKVLLKEHRIRQTNLPKRLQSISASQIDLELD